ncbi:class I SAM-dependent RNA methyltransferase [Sulfitobacter aestuarii]|uniref:Class I SAM-dependent RNA methyltransferase n=1 Tax=Sulfitobacter aestuarii TaxID=2161676 RepID=A0ABW5TYW3_9RHOB
MTEYKIERLGHHGDGIAAGPLYAPLTLPGEVVTGTADGQTLRDIRIVTPSDQRVAAPCRHFRSCGGCQLQHGSDDFVARWKEDVVRTALGAHDITTELRPIVTSPAQSRRRATLAAKRTKKGAMAGFHGRGSDVIVEIPGCQLLTPMLMQSLPIAQELALIGTSRKAVLAVTVTETLDGLDVAASGGKPLEAALREELARFCEKSGLARLTWDDQVLAMRMPPRLRFGKGDVSPPPGAFLQATESGEQALLGAVREAVGDATRIIDLFAGCGTFSLPLAEQAEVLAVEGEAAMLEALDIGWRGAKGLKRLRTETRDLFRRPLLPDELMAAQAVVLDPPRAGAEAQVAELARAGTGRLAYVSCNPVSFARDAAVLIEAGYRLDWVQPVDQFRWSAHIELAAGFRGPEPRTAHR